MKRSGTGGNDSSGAPPAPPPPPPPPGPRPGGAKSPPPSQPPFPGTTPSPLGPTPASVPAPAPAPPKITARNIAAQPVAAVAQHDSTSFPGGADFANVPPVPIMSSPQPPVPAGVSLVPAPQDSSDSLTSPEVSADVPVTGKPTKDRLGKLNRFFQNKKPKPGRLLKGFRRGDAAPGDSPAMAAVEPLPAQPAESEEVKIKRERHAAQMAEYEERLDEWNRDYKRKQMDCELHGLTFDPSEMRPKPTPPAPFQEPTIQNDEPVHSVQGSLAPGLPRPKPQRASSFRPIEQPVVAEGQKASELAEMFAAKAYGNNMHPAAAPGHTTSVTSSSIFGSGTGPMLPPRADPNRAQVQPHAPIPPAAAPSAMNGPTAVQPPPPAVAPHAAPHGPPSFGPTATGYGPAPTQSRGTSMPQRNTYVDPQLADHIRRGRELTKLGIREEESGNMGSAKEAYMKALELLIPAIPMLDHGNDVSYQFRMGEKQKLKREAALMLDRCEQIKRFLESEVAALNTRNLLEQAPVPRMQPRKLSLLRQESMQYDDLGTADDSPGANSDTSGLGLAQKPVTKKRDVNNVMPPPPPPPPPAHLLDGFSSLSLSDPLVQQSRPGPMAPAPMPPALSREQLSCGITKDSPANRQQMLSRPPDGSFPSPPAFPGTPPTDRPHR